MIRASLDPRGTLADRFWSKVNKAGRVVRDELGPCWEWTASADRNGYGQIMCASPRGKRPQRAHRIAWLLEHGDLPDLCVLHRCDNPLCVRVDHLFLGTVTDNNRDMWAKGRGVSGCSFADPSVRAKASENLMRGDAHYARTNPERLARGERHGNTGLTADDVRELRAQRKAGATLRALAGRFGITEGSVSAIAHRRTWRHLP